MTDRLTFLDFETTGLDPEGHLPLEVGIVQTDESGALLYERSLLLRSLPIPQLQAMCVPFVLEMHHKSGLWGALAAPDQALPKIPVERLDIELSWVPGGDKLTVAGFSPHFDLSWLQVWAPTFAARCSHRVFDCSTLRRAAQITGRDADPRGQAAHRSLDDCREALGYWVWFRGLL